MLDFRGVLFPPTCGLETQQPPGRSTLSQKISESLGPWGRWAFHLPKVSPFFNGRIFLYASWSVLPLLGWQGSEKFLLICAWFLGCTPGMPVRYPLPKSFTFCLATLPGKWTTHFHCKSFLFQVDDIPNFRWFVSSNLLLNSIVVQFCPGKKMCVFYCETLDLERYLGWKTTNHPGCRSHHQDRKYNIWGFP